LTLVYGRQDEYFTSKVIAATEARLREQAIPYEVVGFEGGHELNETALKQLDAADAQTRQTRRG